MSDRDRDSKKSWKELDLMRDRGVKTERKKGAMELRAEALASKAAKKELEQLFSNSKVSKEKKARLEEIRSLRGKPEFYEKISKYCEEFGIPVEWDAQILALDHRDQNLVFKVLEQLEVTAPKENMEMQKLILQKLKVMEVSTFDPQMIDRLQKVKAKLLA